MSCRIWVIQLEDDHPSDQTSDFNQKMELSIKNCALLLVCMLVFLLIIIALVLAKNRAGLVQVNITEIVLHVRIACWPSNGIFLAYQSDIKSPLDVCIPESLTVSIWDVKLS